MSVTGRHQGNPYRRTWPALAVAIGLLASPCAHAETPAPPAPPMATETPDAKPKADLAEYWEKTISIGMNLLCLAYTCNVNKSNDADKFTFSAANLKSGIPGLSSPGDNALIYLGEIEVQSSRHGTSGMNGFPKFLKIALRDMQVNDDMAKTIAKLVAPSDMLTQQLLSQELAKTKISLDIDIQNIQEHHFDVNIAVRANSEDNITVHFFFYTPDEIKNFLVNKKIDLAEVQKEDEGLAAIELYESVNWGKILDTPVPWATMTFEERNLLDKFYTKFLFSKKTDGERAYWQKMLNAVLAEPVDDNRKSAAEIIRFLSNWRQKTHRLTVTVADPNALELFGKPPIEKMVGQDSPYCSVGMVLSISIATYYGMLPYLMPDDDAASRAARNAAAFSDNLKDDKLGLGTAELMKFARCNKVQFSATYKAP